MLTSSRNGGDRRVSGRSASTSSRGPGTPTESRCSRQRESAFHLSGRFREVDPPTRLSYSFAWEDPDPDDVETVVDLAFADRGEATEVGLTQGPFRTEARRALHRDGWTESFDKLERHLAARSD